MDLTDDEKPSQPVVNPANKLHPGPAHVASSEAGLEEVAQRYHRAAQAAGKEVAVAASCAEAHATAHTEPASASAHLSGFTAALQAARRAVSELELLVQQSASAAAKANLLPA